MENKNYINKSYKNFGDFIRIVVAKELDTIILDSKFTSMFNYRMRGIIEDIKENINPEAEFSVIFNTNNEIAIIDSEIVGSYVKENYVIKMKAYYRHKDLNQVIREVASADEQKQLEFISISYSILYNTLNNLYMEIKCKKDIIDKYKAYYNLNKYKGDDIVIVVIVLRILEDICKYIGLKTSLLILSFL